MNKKFSTLVATLLVAGVGMTLNAEVIKVTSPKVGGSYLIATGVTAGVAAVGEVGGLLKIAASGTGLDATADIAAAYQAVGGEWTLVDAGIETKKAFYLKKDGKFIYAVAPQASKALAVSADDVYKASRVAFEIVAGKIVVAKEIQSQIAVGDELKIASAVVTLEATAGGTAVAFATYQADSKVTYGGTAANLVATPVKDTYYFIAANDKKLLQLATKDGVAAVVDASSALVANVAQYLWKVTEITVGTTTQYTFENKAFPGKFAKIGQTTSFTASGKYNKGVGLFVGANSVDVDFAAAGTVDAAVAFGFYQAIQLPYTVEGLKAGLGGSFNLSIADADKTEGADVFNGNLVPMGKEAFDQTLGDDKAATSFRLKSGEKFVVLNTKNIWAGNVGDEALKRGAKFELVDVKDIDKADYLSYFRISHTSGNDADKDLQVEVMAADQLAVYGRLFVVSAGESKYLTTSNDIAANETWVSVLKGASNIVDVKTLLGKFWNISYAESKEAAKEQNEVYKLNGVLSVVIDEARLVEDYVDAGSVLLTSPEAQWAVSSVDATNNTFSMVNRELDFSVPGLQLRTTDTPNVYSVSSSVPNVDKDLIKLTEVKNHGKFDGFMKTDTNTLRNQVFHIGQYHNETGNAVAYWTENHGGSHKLGVSTENATDWKLSLAMKAVANIGEINEVDTLLIVTNMAVWKDGGFVDEAQPDTLAVLRYKFQNNSNLEYVLYKGNKLNYYACDEVADRKENGVSFALKMKPNGTYNIVTAESPFGLGLGKVYVANSDQKGALGNMDTYTKDNNSLMVIEELAKPEYRKVAKEWGDVVKIYREEYPTEVLFEKLDAKSVVDNDTLSFLNVNNSVTGANPALFVDTAYVNRVDTNGVKNTRYQYLLAVNVDKENTTFCPFDAEHNTAEWQEANGGPCPHAKANPAVVKGRFLINLVDTAFAYKQEHLHNNPYINMVEADENLAKLSFVEGYHSQDTLYITRKGGEVVKLAMDDPNFNVAKFAFRYVNNEAGSFKIQTQSKKYNSSASQTQKDFDESAHNEGYLRWVNGTVVVTNTYLNGETFNMEEGFAGQPVSNDDITASSINVVATNGAVIINNAAGKAVVINNILGQTIAQTVLTSDNATISVPAGIVVVTVEGEAAVKAIVR